MVRTNKTAKKELASETRTEPEKSTSKLKTEIRRKSATATASDEPTAISRYIPAKIRHDLEQKYLGHCAYRGCNKPAEHIHHQNRFALKHNHENVVPLCKAHHDLIHQTSKTDQIFNRLKSEFAASSVLRTLHS